MSVSRRQTMIKYDHETLSVTRQCELLKICRSSLYYKKTGESAYNVAIMNEIDKAYTEWPFFGVRQMRRYLTRLGYTVGNKRVRRLMRLMGMMAIYQKPCAAKPNPNHKKYPYLLRNMEICRCNQVWRADITYIPMRKGFLYLAAVMDWHSHKALAWRLSNTMDTDFRVSALEEAMSKYGKPEIFNTDQGSQFTSDAFTRCVTREGIAISMDGRGRCLDNVFIERLWRLLKYDEVYLKAYENGGEARIGIDKWLTFYNMIRPHSSLGGQTPDSFYEAELQKAA